MTDLYLDEIPEDLNQDNPFHINGFPREILIEIFRYIKTLEDRHNAMLVCKYWYEILQDPCFVVTCPEILTLKYYEITADCEPFKALYWSSRKFNQVRLNCLNWSDDDDQLLEQFFRHLGRDARIVYYTDSLEWKNFLTFFPKMTELRVDTLETLKPYTQFAVELHSVVVKNLDPKTVDLTMPIFSQIKSLKASTRFKIVPDHQVSSGLNILLDENLKFSLSKFCDLNDVRIVTGANLLRQVRVDFSNRHFMINSRGTRLIYYKYQKCFFFITQTRGTFRPRYRGVSDCYSSANPNREFELFHKITKIDCPIHRRPS